MKRNKFSLSHNWLMSFDMGQLIPMGPPVEVLPGDTLQHATNLLLRVSPLVAPVMHPCHVRVHHWFVPHRLVWEDWEKFITGGPDGMDASVFPTLTNATGFSAGGLGDYYGIPPTGVSTTVSALPFRGYVKIWNEFYRDQDLHTPITEVTASGPESPAKYALQRVSWEKDYFTTARPWTQKGPVVSLPLTGNAPIQGIGWTAASAPGGTSASVRETDGTSKTYPISSGLNSAAAFVGKLKGTTGNASPEIYADLTNVTAATINELRLAMALQRYEEARARYGSRYTEYLRYLGVRSSDARLQRPEYLGGGKQTIQFSEVLQTGVTTAGTTAGVGNLKGHGIAAVRSNRYRRFFEEHGYVHSFISVKPRTVYSQGIARTYNRRVKEDFWQRELEHIGQQEIHNKELYAAHSSPDGVFGYQDRYDEYRRFESGVSGEFRSTLNYWHLARDFSSEPVLNGSFITSTPTNRIFADQTSDTLLVMASHSIQARRMLARTGTSFIF
ncbi:major capsid protein [Microvirus D_HF4_329]|nr:major capsid protein [Microvirus D_HF4_329]